MKRDKTNRRDFLKVTASGAGALSLPGMLEAMDVPYIILNKGIDGLDVFSERQRKNGETNRVNTATAPPLSPIFMMPSHSAISPM